MNPVRIFPIILAGGDSSRFATPKPLAEFDGRTALELAVANCEGMERPIVVLGHRAEEIRRRVPKGARVAINREWHRGQLSSLLAGLRLVPRGAAFLLYPVDQPLLTAALVSRLVRAFNRRGPGKCIVMPRKGTRAGHPILCAGELRSELRRAQTARDVVYRDSRRVRYVPVRDVAIWTDFDSPATYRRCLRLFRRQRQKAAAPFALANSSRAAIPAEAQGYRRQRRDHQR
jgi:molybdenum cofactor cytidylyltransferase